VETTVKKHLIPKLDQYFTEVTTSREKGGEAPEESVAKLCVVMESVSAILKVYSDEKNKTIRQVFTRFVSILSRINERRIQDCCLHAILRLQRFIDSGKEIYEMIKSHQENSNGVTSASLRFAITTFVHRKCDKIVKNAK